MLELNDGDMSVKDCETTVGARQSVAERDTRGCRERNTMLSKLSRPKRERESVEREGEGRRGEGVMERRGKERGRSRKRQKS